MTDRFKKTRLASCVIVAFLLLTATWQSFPAFSQTEYPATTLLRSTREESIFQALRLLENSQPGRSSLDALVNKQVRIVYKDMKSIHKALKNYDALSWISSQGQQVIFVNEKHRTAPPEALAAMIAHEAMHDDPFNSVNEEVESWQVEAQVWMEMKARNPQLGKIPVGQNSLVDRENKIEEEARKGTLAAFVRSSPGYQGLPEISPGFGPTSISNRDAKPAF